VIIAMVQVEPSVQIVMEMDLGSVEIVLVLVKRIAQIVKDLVK
jgi:hypothetical protein